LGHANPRVTYAVAKQAHTASSPVDLTIAPPKCASCILGKQARTPVPKSREGTRSTEHGTTFFLDAGGTQCTRSASRNVCLLDIVDDFSLYGWTIPVPSKGHCGPALRSFIIAR
ncbi:hypothetical protein FKP32DRAFT_1528341, partial [Trametes sanguinea]